MIFIKFAFWLASVLAPDGPEVPTHVDFQRDVRPILERRCQPCHFEGGKMYARLPFDKAETIDKLGEKLFTRIKKEEEQAIIRAYLAR
jgi:hypothetical protein